MRTRLEVLYEDNHLIIVNKPCTLATQNEGKLKNSLYDLLKKYLSIKGNKKDFKRYYF